ncbi:MDR family MFS transporter [Fredinandcohnia sp. QZ13]|uniref:MDR family MFS transporter n=1 Tax=Fredinandcohnia sp. QZ13 TaxID=3073144 RepID=UPI002852FE8D|nr:MDR family MFS transporter [Fredinandcohnia sp. QZ13]MDR4886145.1 MDR family MFS transporter [Fredinandcohnia sp. QZ13]
MKSKPFVLVSIVLAMLISAMDTTILQTTAPTIAETLGGYRLYGWMFAIYVLFSTVSLPIFGKLADIYGRKKIFSISIILFTIGSLLCGLADSMVELIVYRGIQGLGAGGVSPLTMIIAGDLYSIEKRGKIQGFFSAMWGVSAVIAPLIGGFFVETMSWRWIFFINIPIGIIVLLCLIPYQENITKDKNPLNYLSAFFFTGSMLAFLMNTITTENLVIYNLIGVILLVAFIFAENKSDKRFIPIEILKNKNISWMNINGLLIFLSIFAFQSYVPLFMQKVQGISIIVSGLVLFGMSAAWMFASVPSGKFIMKYGYRNTIFFGNALLVLSAIMALFMNKDTSFFYIFVILTIQGFAFGLVVTIGTIGSQELAEAHQKGMSTSLHFFARNIGTTFGASIMGMLITNQVDVAKGMHHLNLFMLIAVIAATIISFLASQKLYSHNLQKQ